MADDNAALRSELVTLTRAVERLETLIADRDAQPGKWFKPTMSLITEGIGKHVRELVARELGRSEQSTFDVQRALERRLTRLEDAARK